MVAGIETIDRLILTGTPAWHGLGVVVPEAPTVREAFEKALPWDVRLVPACYLNGPSGLFPAVATDDVAKVGEYFGRVSSISHDFRAAPGQVVLAGSDATGWEPISVVGPDYSKATNRDVATLAETFEDVSGGKVETIGSLRGRRAAFVLLRVGSYGVGLGSADETYTYLAILWAHDGSGAVRLFFTTVRVVCANTYAQALGKADGRGEGISIRHVGDVGARLEEAREAIRSGSLALQRVEDEDRELARTSLDVAKVGEYFGRVSSILFPAVATERPGDDKEAAAWERQRARARETVSAWVEELEHDRQALVSGTAFAALQSVTRWADHGRDRVRNVAADRLVGRGANIKRAAREAALSLIGG